MLVGSLWLSGLIEMTDGTKLIADFIAEFFVRKGTKNVYSLPGGGAMYLMDAFTKSKQINHVSFFHEQGASIAAETASRTAKNLVGVCCVTTGPGATNAITAVAGAWIESSPLIVLSGQVKRSDMLNGRPLRQTGVQEVEITKLIEPITKFSAVVKDPKDVEYLLEKAYSAATSDRKGPVWLDVPLDVQGSPVPQQLRKPAKRRATKYQVWDGPLVVKMIASAERPLFFWGNGAKLDSTKNVARSFINEFNFPSLFSWNASDLLEYDHRLNFGRPGVVAQRHANFIIQKADLIVSIGSSLDNVITAYNPKNFGKRASKVIVDIDKNQLKHLNLKNLYKIHTAAFDFISKLTLELRNKNFFMSNGTWISECSKLKQEFENDLPSEFKEDECISHKSLILELSRLLKAGQLIATGSSGLAIEAFYMMFRNKINQKYFLTSGLGAMGYGLPSSIGISIENPGEPVILVESDGSLAMNVQELQTVVNNNLAICIVLMNNNGYASIRNTQSNYFSGRYFGTGEEAGQMMPNWNMISKGFGFQYFETNKLDKLEGAIHNFYCDPKPTLIDIKLKSHETLAPKCSAIPQVDGDIISMPLEDMSPLLSLKKLKSVMGSRLDKSSISARNET